MKEDMYYGYLYKVAGDDSRVKKINSNIARHIIKCRINGVPTASLAAMFGITKGTVEKILRGEQWAAETIEERKLYMQRPSYSRGKYVRI